MSTAELDARTLPHNLELERSILGAVLLHGECLADVADELDAADFYRSAHRIIFEHMGRLVAKNVEIDLPTLRDSLATSGALDEVGGPAYLAALADGMPRSSNVRQYAAAVREKAELRRLIAAGNRLTEQAYDAEHDARAVLDAAEQSIFEILHTDRARGFRRLSDVLPGVMDSIQHWCNTKHGVTGIASGFTDLDVMTRGFQPGNLVIIAARPAMGKSAFVLNVAQYVATAGKTVGFFSLEMSNEELAVRAITAEAHVDGHRLQRGHVYESEWSRLAAVFGKLDLLNLYIDESPFVTVLDIRSRSRRLKAQHGLDLLIVDYAQLMVGHEKKENRNLELASITRSLKGLAKDIGVPVVALSQLSRDLERRTDKRPMLSDLRDSGALEQDADLVLFLYRDEVYHPESADKGKAEIIIAKQRTGPIGTVTLAWIPEETRFANYTAQPEPDDRRVS